MESYHLEQRLIFSSTTTLLRSNTDIDPHSLTQYTNTLWDIEESISFNKVSIKVNGGICTSRH